MEHRIPLTQIPWSVALLALPAKICGTAANIFRCYGRTIAILSIATAILFVGIDLMLYDIHNRSFIIEPVCEFLGVFENEVPQNIPVRPH